MEKAAQEAGFALRNTPIGITPVPLKDGRPMNPEEFGSLESAEQERCRAAADGVQHAVGRMMAEIRRLNKEATEQAREVDKEVVRFTLTPIIDELQDKYGEFPDVVEYLDRVEADMVDHLDAFKPKEEAPSQPMAVPGARAEEDTFVRADRLPAPGWDHDHRPDHDQGGFNAHGQRWLPGHAGARPPFQSPLVGDPQEDAKERGGQNREHRGSSTARCPRRLCAPSPFRSTSR